MSDIGALISMMSQENGKSHGGSTRSRKEGPKTFEAAQELIHLLTTKQSKLTSVKAFCVGDIVENTPGLNITMLTGPMIVTRKLDEIIWSTEEESGSIYFRQPLDIVCGTMDVEGDLLEHHLDSRRLRHYVAPTRNITPLDETTCKATYAN